MKKVIYSLPMKITVFILCVISIISVFLSALAVTRYYTQHNVNQSLIDRYKSISYSGFSMQARNLIDNIVLHDGNGDAFYGASYTNMRFIVTKYNNEIVFNNTGREFVVGEGKEWYKNFYQVWPSENENYHSTSQVVNIPDYLNETNVYTVYGYIDTDFPIYDTYSYDYYTLKFEYDVLNNISLIKFVFVISAVILIATFTYLMAVSGRRAECKEAVQGISRKIPFDFIVVLFITLIILMICFLVDGTGDRLCKLIFKALTLITGCSLFVGTCMIFATRLKTGSFLKNNIIYFVISFMLKIIKKIIKLALCAPFILRSMAVVAATVAIDLFILVLATSPSYSDSSFSVSLWFIRTTIYVLGALYISIMLYKLKKTGEALANGDLQHKTDTTLLVLDFKKHGENLNNIASGMADEVESRIRSERLKTELITNVSHDLKTPLTSIINYSELIANEECESEKHKEYSDVLLRKSKHLKRLLDDLLEVSKASSGNMEVILSRVDTGILLNQLSGEYEDKISQNKLQLVISEPPETLYAMADERRIWRVFENLMNNACKYSLGGSRVYINLFEKENEVIFSFKNTSATQLNITPSELTERFVRGDSSRTSEGSGLGLSIASTFTEIQGGRFEIIIDGDLFRVDVALKKA